MVFALSFNAVGSMLAPYPPVIRFLSCDNNSPYTVSVVRRAHAWARVTTHIDMLFP